MRFDGVLAGRKLASFVEVEVVFGATGAVATAETNPGPAVTRMKLRGLVGVSPARRSIGVLGFAPIVAPLSARPVAWPSR